MIRARAFLPSLLSLSLLALACAKPVEEEPGVSPTRTGGSSPSASGGSSGKGGNPGTGGSVTTTGGSSGSAGGAGGSSSGSSGGAGGSAAGGATGTGGSAGTGGSSGTGGGSGSADAAADAPAGGTGGTSGATDAGGSPGETGVDDLGGEPVEGKPHLRLCPKAWDQAQCCQFLCKCLERLCSDVPGDKARIPNCMSMCMGLSKPRAQCQAYHCTESKNPKVPQDHASHCGHASGRVGGGSCTAVMNQK